MDWSKTRAQFGHIVPLVLFPMLLGSLVVIAWLFRTEIAAQLANVESLRDEVQAMGLRGFLYTGALQVLQVVIFILPGETVQIAAGYLHGVTAGVAVSMVGILIGSCINFGLGRLLGRPFVDAIVPSRHRGAFDATIERRSTLVAYIVLFIIPGMPKDILGYLGGAAGGAALPFRSFLLYSMLGRLPGIVGSAVIGHAAGSGYPIVAVSLLSAAALVAVLGVVYQRRIRAWISARSSHS